VRRDPRGEEGGRHLDGIHDKGRSLGGRRGVKGDRSDVSHLELSRVAVGDDVTSCGVDSELDLGIFSS
jgi:hypothetical protein